jgi:gamma-glutamyltranspeptidase / glutathione hydrolase
MPNFAKNLFAEGAAGRKPPMNRLRFRVALLLVTVFAVTAGNRASDHTQGRSMVMTRYGIVSAESPLAAQAGADILAHGGNAVDAAVATNAVMGVVEPMMNGMGGDLFAIVYDAKTQKLYGLNASGWSPKALRPEHFKDENITSMPVRGIDSVTVPGAVDGWSKLLTRFGKLNLQQLLEPAIRYAREGFPVPEWDADYWAGGERSIRKNPSESVYLLNGRAPKTGDIFRNEDLARSLEIVAKGGRDAYYNGELARQIVEFSRSQGGTMTLEDLADYSSEWVEPISTVYRGWTVYELPPNSQGIAALEMLNIMSQYPMAQYGQNSVDSLHVMIEAKKLAYADLIRYVGDPRSSKIPLEGMLSLDYARARAGDIDMKKASCSVEAGAPPAEAGDTTYLSVVDRDGNMVSLIQSNFALFGAELAVGGFVLQNRGGLFNLTPGSPDVLAGHKRPLHTIIPAFMTKGELRIAFGIMGGYNQAQAHAQFVSNIADFGMNVQAALESPRFTKPSFSGCDLEMENRVPEEVRVALTARGHQIRLEDPYSDSMGGGQATERNFATGVNFGGSDPRKDGESIPEAPSGAPAH